MFIFSILNAIIILILDILIKPVAYYLTLFENHKSKQGFEWSYAIKLFVFKGANNFGSLVYIAFGKQDHVGCISEDNNNVSDEHDCLWELSMQLIFIFIAYLLQNAYEILVPFCRSGRAGRNIINADTIKGKSDESILKMKIHTEHHRVNYDEGEINGVVDEYMEI